MISDLPKSKLDDHSFSRAWSKSETTGGADKGQAASAAGQTGSFERQQTKYKSDGKGFTRINLIKQCSLIFI